MSRTDRWNSGSYKYLFKVALDFVIDNSGNRRKLCVTGRAVRAKGSVPEITAIMEVPRGIQHGARKTDFSAPLVSVITQPLVEIRAEMIQGRVMEPTA